MTKNEGSKCSDCVVQVHNEELIQENAKILSALQQVTLDNG